MVAFTYTYGLYVKIVRQIWNIQLCGHMPHIYIGMMEISICYITLLFIKYQLFFKNFFYFLD